MGLSQFLNFKFGVIILLLKKNSFNSHSGVKITPKTGVIFAPYMGCFHSFWSYFNSKSGVKF